MNNLHRLGLGCMGMGKARNYDMAVQTVHTALQAGVTLLNTGDFYQMGDSEMILGDALKGVPRQDYFLSVKYGVLHAPEGGIYGLDVHPDRVKAYLGYSLRRLGVDYLDLYQPARIDTAIAVEEVIGGLVPLVESGYIKHIGLSMVDADTLRRAHRVHPIHTVEMAYSLVNRDIETDLLATAKELGIRVLAFGTAGHGLLTERLLAGNPGNMPQERYEKALGMVKALQQIAQRKQVTLTQLALAWSLAKYDHVQSLIGTANPAHLQSAVAAMQLQLSEADIAEMEAAVPAEFTLGGKPNYVYTNGKVVYLR